jgi:hypothetical protein
VARKLEEGNEEMEWRGILGKNCEESLEYYQNREKSEFLLQITFQLNNDQSPRIHMNHYKGERT